MLSPLLYHQRTTQFFRQQTNVWNFFSNNQHKENQLKEFKADLLKNTYRFDPKTDVTLFEKVQKAKEKLEISMPVFLYQAENTDDLNASIIYVNNEVHIVFSGKIIQLLNDEELQAVIAHELSHIKLYTELNGDIEVADRIITSIANNAGSTPAHYETARLFKLYNEIFCDRGAYLVTGSYAPIISSLVKIATGLQTVNAESYIKQAEEIFSSDSDTKASGVSHPENFIRARAISLWDSQGNASEQSIVQMIEGDTNFEELDLFKQQQLHLVTRNLIQIILNPDWMQTTFTISLGKQYFPDLQLTEIIDKTALARQIENLHSTLVDYLTYVLYDFATADKILEDVPLGYCFYLADEFKIEKAFANSVKKERKLTDKKTTILKKKLLATFQEQGVQAN